MFCAAFCSKSSLEAVPVTDLALSAANVFCFSTFNASWAALSCSRRFINLISSAVNLSLSARSLTCFTKLSNAVEELPASSVIFLKAFVAVTSNLPKKLICSAVKAAEKSALASPSDKPSFRKL